MQIYKLFYWKTLQVLYIHEYVLLAVLKIEVAPVHLYIFYLHSHEHTDSLSNSEDVVVLMDTFKSKIINMKVGKRSGMASQNLLSDDEDEGEEGTGIWDSISR